MHRNDKNTHPSTPLHRVIALQERWVSDTLYYGGALQEQWVSGTL
ncbi:hypothetical protein [Pontibacillus chungwhensis]|uniref:Uncharacterized protein n=1 Tax=Pontibacillus chungwhensis TaxID=265426 RepID=A0ABY8UYQ6_9BACI|nr:hypothetical protein [Pontibacillus chungwhensis]WIF98323.1 hypothetical protein QNI29_01155 [Pontibacillus chungwhensis]